MKYLGEAKMILEITIKRITNDFSMCQSRYIEKNIKKF